MQKVSRAEILWLKIIGLLLILLGLTLLASPRITYTTKEKVVHSDSIDLIAKREKTISVPRVVALLIAAGGVTTLIFAGRASRT
jgi:hypothetical protein